MSYLKQLAEELYQYPSMRTEIQDAARAYLEALALEKIEGELLRAPASVLDEELSAAREEALARSRKRNRELLGRTKAAEKTLAKEYLKVLRRLDRARKSARAKGALSFKEELAKALDKGMSFGQAKRAARKKAVIRWLPPEANDLTSLKEECEELEAYGKYVSKV